MKCSFCNKPESEVGILIKGMNESHICDVCIRAGYDIIEVNIPNTPNTKNINVENDLSKMLISPKHLKDKLDEHVIGQDKAKRSLCISIFNHYIRLIHKEKENSTINIQKSNILMVGPTGTGKTLLAKTIADIINVPFCIADATVLTEAGYVGEDVESIISKLLQVANYDVKKAEKGIIFIDEIDKISRKNANPSITRDVSGEGVQQALLKLLEGSTINVAPEGGRKHPNQKFVQVDTSNILFIAGGAFDGIKSIILRRLKTNALGFNTQKIKDINEDNYLKAVNSNDIKTYGLIPEIIGRFPVITHLNEITPQELTQIITKPKNAISKQYAETLKYYNVEVIFKTDAIEYIAELAIELKLGARGLRTIFEEIFHSTMFNTTNKKTRIEVDKTFITKNFSMFFL